MRVLETLAGKFRKAVQREGFVTPDGTLGIEVTGTLNGTLFAAIATSVPEGTWEFVCHPGYNDSDLQSAKTRLRESREVELECINLAASSGDSGTTGDRVDPLSRFGGTLTRRDLAVSS